MSTAITTTSSQSDNKFGSKFGNLKLKSRLFGNNNTNNRDSKNLEKGKEILEESEESQALNAKNSKIKNSSSSSSSKEINNDIGTSKEISTQFNENNQQSEIEIENFETIEIKFFQKDQPYFWLSNSSDHSVYFDNLKYSTAEHLFQSLKFLPHKPDLANKIRKQNNPIDAIHEARKYSIEIKKGWIATGLNLQAMNQVLILKFTQHSSLQSLLLQTGESQLIQDSPIDAFWGIASGTAGGGVGRNELGKSLMKTRETLRSQAGIGIGSASKTV